MRVSEIVLPFLPEKSVFRLIKVMINMIFVRFVLGRLQKKKCPIEEALQKTL